VAYPARRRRNEAHTAEATTETATSRSTLRGTAEDSPLPTDVMWV
jgi:hypothetical protein